MQGKTIPGVLCALRILAHRAANVVASFGLRSVRAQAKACDDDNSDDDPRKFYYSSQSANSETP